MDSLTQIVLGAYVGAAVMGKRYGRKAALIGAICGTVPDLDVLLPTVTPVESFTTHRGFSHSFLFALLMTPFLAWVISKIKWFGIEDVNKVTMMGIFLALVTHPLLDAMTIYGTQLLWPLSTPPIGLGSIFIVDPLYTLPFLLCLMVYLLAKSRRALLSGLIISTLYLGWTVLAQHHVTTLAHSQVPVPAEKILAQPTPFNTILWRIVVMTDEGYDIGYYSLLDKSKTIEFESYTNTDLLLSETNDVQRLQWFTKGFYGVRVVDGDIIFSDLRMGLEPDQYVFQYNISDDPATKHNTPRDMSRLPRIWQRMIRDVL